MNLFHRVILPLRPTPRPPLLVLLHGLGADEEDLLPLAMQVDPRFLVASARAPREAMPLGFAWFAVDWSTSPPRVDPAEVATARDLLLGFVEEVGAAHGTDPARVFLLGFSQGAMVALGAGLARPDLVRGVVAHSGRLVPELVPRPLPPGLARLEVLLLHGADDDVVPAARGREARDSLAPLLGDRVRHREWPGLGHAISGESLGEAAGWLADRL